jgi:hypothetical protein
VQPPRGFKMSSSGKRVLLVIGGGIAAYAAKRV